MGLFRSHAGSVVTPSYTALQIQTSTSALPIPIVWGINIIAPNIIWSNDFAAIPQYAASGGKGGGGSTSVSGYTYSTAIMLGLCEGPITNVGAIWQNSSTYSASGLGFTYFSGTTPQTVWGYLSSAQPGEAINYPGLAYLASSNYDLGSSGTLDITYLEVYGVLYPSAVVNAHDADPALIIQDFLTNAQYGVGFPPASIDASSLLGASGDSSYQTYCQAAGLALSPALVDQEAANGILSRWLQLTNTAAVWSGGQLKFVPYGDSGITGALYGGTSSVTFNPNLTPVYDLTDDDFIYTDGDDPVQVARTDPYAAYNFQALEIFERSNSYAATPINAFDQNAIDLYGLVMAPTLTAHEICDAGVAMNAAQLILQRGLYIRNTYTFKLSWEYCLLEPMDLVTITDAGLGLAQAAVRITAIDEDSDGLLTVMAEEFPAGAATAVAYPVQTSAGHATNRNQAPEPVNAPLIFEPPSSLTDGAAQVWIGLSGGASGMADPNWGGAVVWISTDNTTYSVIGTVSAPARQGILTAALATASGQSSAVPPFTSLDAAHTLAVNMAESAGVLNSGTLSDAENGVTLCIVDGELLSYETAILTGANAYALTNLTRGIYGSSPAAHAPGAQFTRLDNAIFKYDLPSNYIGVPFYLKFQSFNIFGNAPQSLAACTAYSYTPAGSGTFGPIASSLAAGNNADCGLTSATAAEYDNFGLASDPYPNFIDLGLASS